MSSMNGAGAGVAVSTKAYFVGKYIDNLRDVYLAALLAGVNAVSIGGPGLGKTDVALSMLEDIFGKGNFSLTRISPATPIELIEGPIDVEGMIKNSRFDRKVAGTPMDPTLGAHLVDEIFRGNSMVLQSLMFATDRKDVKFAPPVLGTANFLPRGDEFEALMDRFALWHWVDDGSVDAGAIARAVLSGGGNRLHVRGTLPAASDILDIQAAVSAVGPHAVDAVANVIDQLASDAAAAGLNVNPRRVVGWSQVLLRCGIYYSGSADFASVPAKAMSMLRFAWRSSSAEDAKMWAQLASAVSDPIAAGIDSVMADAAAVVNAAIDKVAGDPASLAVVVGDIGTKLVKLQGSLNALGNDPRIAEANATMMSWFGNLTAGRKVER